MKDYIVRAIAADSQIRAFAAVTTETVETARQDHNTSPVATAALGRLLTAGSMMGVMMKGDKDILTLQVKGDGLIQGITVTADSKGRVKGYVGNLPLRLLSSIPFLLAYLCSHIIKSATFIKVNGNNISN